MASTLSRRSYYYGAFSAGMFLAGNLALAAVLRYGGSLVLSQELSIGELMSFVLYTGYIAASLGILTSLFNDIMKVLFPRSLLASNLPHYLTQVWTSFEHINTDAAMHYTTSHHCFSAFIRFSSSSSSSIPFQRTEHH